MIKYTQTIRRLLPTNCLSVLDHSMRLALKGLKCLSLYWKTTNFEFNGKVKRQLLGTGIRTKCAPAYAWIFTDKKSKTQANGLVPLYWWHLFYLNSQQFVKEVNKTHPNLKFMHDSIKGKISFLDFSVKFSQWKALHRSNQYQTSLNRFSKIIRENLHQNQLQIRQRQ